MKKKGGRVLGYALGELELGKLDWAKDHRPSENKYTPMTTKQKHKGRGGKNEGSE